MPKELAYLAPIIVMIAGYIAVQATENKRVDIAEQLVRDKYAKIIPVEDVDPADEYQTLNEEYETDAGEEEDDGC